MVKAFIRTALSAMALFTLLITTAGAQGRMQISSGDTVFIDVQPDAEEIAILKEFYQKMNGPSWKNKTNWLKGTTSVDVAKWYGVEVENGDVVGIHLQNNNLSTTLSQNIYDLKRLRTLEWQTVQTQQAIARTAAADVTPMATLAASGGPAPIIRGKNLPVWGLAVNGPAIQELDWRNIPPKAKGLPKSGVSKNGAAGVAIDDCGRLAFYALHAGVDSEYQLHLYSGDGTRLTNTIAGDQKCAFNSAIGNVEMQVVRVPGTSNEWFVIYSLWQSNCSPAGSTYCGVKVAYSRVSYDNDTGVFNVISRDVVVATSNVFIQGKAVSPLVFDNPAIGPYHYLYLAQRNSTNAMRISRFRIHANGIDSEQVSAAAFTLDYWSGYGISGSSVALTQDGNTLAISNRNQDDLKDVAIFDVTKFTDASYNATTFNINDLMVDFTWNNQPVRKSVRQLWGEAPYSSEYSCFQYMKKKLSNIEFSPSGRFLYLTNGGYQSASNNIHHTYLIQVDLQSAVPYNVRIQRQGGYNLSSTTCSAGGTVPTTHHSVSLVEAAFDGRVYFTKSNSPYLFVIPHPDDLMPQDLTPHDINLAEPGAPNILLSDGSQTTYMPENIDGFDYLVENSTIKNFIIEVPSVAIGQTAKVRMINYNPKNTYQVSWGDGVVETLTSATRTHRYSAVGNYSVILLVIDEFNCALKTRQMLEVVPCPAVTDITIENTTYLCAIKFNTRKLENCLTTYSWNFGDQTTSAERNPIHAYGTPGTYTVTLNVSYNCSGCTGTKTTSKQITVTDPTPTLGQKTIIVPTDQRLEVISTAATSFSNAWPLHHFDLELDNHSAYETGSQGVWRPNASFVYEKERKQSPAVALATDGTYTLDQFNWEYADENIIPGWIKANSMTQYSPFSYELENRDVLDIYSAALYDYGGHLAVANGNNMRQDEMAFTSFEYREEIDGMPSPVTGNWVFSNEIRAAYVDYKVLIANSNLAVVNASLEQLENVVSVDIATTRMYWFLRSRTQTYTRNEIICREPYPQNPAWSIVILKEAPYAGIWAGSMRVKNIITPPATATIDTQVFHAGKKSLKITAPQMFRQELLHLDAGKSYYFSGWVSIGNASVSTPVLASELGVEVLAYHKNGQLLETVSFNPSGIVIEGWQQLKGSFVCPANTAYIETRFKPGSTGTAWYDDIRFHPENGNMKSYVFNITDYRLQAVLDEENFASFFYYDSEGNLYLSKIETNDGIKTLSENVSHFVKRPTN